MRYTLMNYSYESAEIDITENGDAKILSITDCDRLPFGIQYSPKDTIDQDLTKWMHQRVIPGNRKGLSRLRLIMPEDMLMNSLRYSRGQSLSDGFWFRKEGETATYDDISYREHGFSESLGDYILMNGEKTDSFNAPELATNGMLGKAWKKKNGRFFLYKMGSCPNHEEPYNEVMASEIMSRMLSVPCVSYELDFVNGRPVSVCEGFLHDGEELVTAEEILESTERKPGWTIDMIIRQRCRELSIPGAEDFLNEMKVLDYLISNQDRHLGNYGFIRDVKTLRFKGPAPIFDNGTSLWVDDRTMTSSQTVEQMKHSLCKAVRHDMLLFRSSSDLKALAESVYSKSGITNEQFRVLADGLSERNTFLIQEAEKSMRMDTLNEKMIDEQEMTR